MTIGQNIKYYRKLYKLTQKEIADKLNIPYQMIGQYENGIRNPKHDRLLDIATAIGISVNCLYDDNSNVSIDFKAPCEGIGMDYICY